MYLGGDASPCLLRVSNWVENRRATPLLTVASALATITLGISAKTCAFFFCFLPFSCLMGLMCITSLLVGPVYVQTSRVCTDIALISCLAWYRWFQASQRLLNFLLEYWKQTRQTELTKSRMLSKRKCRLEAACSRRRPKNNPATWHLHEPG